MAWLVAFAPCGRCGRAFPHNPARVPTCAGQLVCRECFDSINLTRECLGMTPWPVPDGAYEAADTAEVWS